MKSFLSIMAILWLAISGSSASAAGKADLGVHAKIKATGKIYRIHTILKARVHLVHAAVAAAAVPVAVVPITLSEDVAEVAAAADVTAGYDSAAMSSDHHVRWLIVAEPADAVIYVDGKRAGTSPTEIAWDGRAGELHKVSVQKVGWEASEQTFSQGVGDAAVYVRLLPADGDLIADIH